MSKLFMKVMTSLSIYCFIFSSVSCKMKDDVGFNSIYEQCPKVCQCNKEVNIWFKVSCIGKQLTDVPNHLNFFTKSLDLSSNNITVIRRKSYDRLHFVENLDLGNNEITTMEMYSFKDLRKLKVLRLHGNRLTVIPENTFIFNLNLKRLHLSANLFEAVGNNSLKGLRNLEELHLDKNLLKNIPISALQKTPSLTFLNLAVNQIHSIENDAFSSLPNLQVLILRDNVISEIGGFGFRGLANCIMIKLDGNKLSKFPQTTKQLKKMVEFTFSNNEIREIPNYAFENQSQLRTLAFDNNPLERIGVNAFTNLPQLHTILIENVTNQRIFPDFSGCNNVRELSVTGGKIVDLPMDLCSKLPLLNSLSVQDNNLLNISAIVRCTYLTKLDASGNKLIEVGQSEFRNARKLSELDLSWNEIKFLDENVFGNLQLTKLNLAGNQFPFLPVTGLRRLTALNLSATYTLLYLPPPQLFTSLRILDAPYSYHCCQFLDEWPEIRPQNWDNAPTNHEPVSCYPKPGPLSPCANLLPLMIVRVVLWVVLTTSASANFLIISYYVIRSCVTIFKKHSRNSKYGNTITSGSYVRKNGEKQTITSVLDPPTSSSDSYFGRGDAFELALCHLSVSDVIACVYVAIILAYDAETRNNFAESGAWWEKSVPCRVAGVFLVLGLQLSFFTVIIATMERYIITMYPLKPEKHVGKTVVVLSLSAAWVISIATVIVTLYSAEDNKGYNPIGVPSSTNGATCLPWSTQFPYVAVLVAFHIVLCLFVSVLCLLMFCARRKQSWLSAQKHTRRQIAFTVAGNVLLILPLALIGLLASAMSTYPPATEAWSTNVDIDYFSYKTAQINVEFLHTFVIFLISLRFILNPFVYIIFGERFRKDCLHAVTKMCSLNRRGRYQDCEFCEDENGFSKGTAAEFTFQGGSVLSIPLEDFESSDYEKYPMDSKYASSSSDSVCSSHRQTMDDQDILPKDIPSTSKWLDDDTAARGTNYRPHHQISDSPESDFEISHIDSQISTNNHDSRKYRKVFYSPATKRLPPWALHSVVRALPCGEDNKLPHSCESSTSKDSGIHSELDCVDCTGCNSKNQASYLSNSRSGNTSKQIQLNNVAYHD